MTPVLQFHQLQKSFSGKTTRCLFSGVSARMDQPESVALLGASGQGKSTLLRIVALLDQPDAGELSLHGKPAAQWPPREWRMRVCYVAQQSVMLPGTVEDNLRTVSILHNRTFEKELARKLLTRLGLEHLDLGKKAADLSGGEKQRVALVRSLLLRPEIFLLDEVTASLDIHSKQAVEQVLVEWYRQEGAGLIWVTHDMEQARTASDKVWFMAEGTLVECTATAEFFDQPATLAARRFIQVAVEGEG
ncbi:ABC transporter ATP-binding protein [Paenibacillus sp. y28]|uniref:ABC transporter ATP-binding protein n=1 Tax=Paenibacillus sp. y28 TaxID=3129110 RepID=UPI00301A7043